jgi:uncharacterized membrane protein YgdD (TMEM256/DUF423 family)
LHVRPWPCLLGAAGAHALANLPELSQSWFRTALQYQQFHALGLLAIGLLADRVDSRWISLAGWLMIVGTLLFSGNLYLRSLADFHALHAVTPWGGMAFILAMQPGDAPWIIVSSLTRAGNGRSKREILYSRRGMPSRQRRLFSRAARPDEVTTIRPYDCSAAGTDGGQDLLTGRTRPGAVVGLWLLWGSQSSGIFA